ncbi:MAG: amidohydrolase family protein, partial [Eubacteriales bacterium]|nr:amidohydrolase family protein [Eubacteriales bacterium]
PGTLQALQCGVTSIEHGLELDERCIDLMLQNDATLVSTISIATGIPRWMGHVAPHIYEKGCLVAKTAVASIRLALERGVRIALGTDYGNSKNTPYRHNGREIEALVTEAGFTSMQAIQAATVNGAHLLKRPDLGTLAAGQTADVIMVSGNPLTDISILADGENVKLVLQNGVVVKRSLC